jgi:thiol:disulfide interchange protein
MRERKRMPFGAIYGVLFFAVAGFWLAVGTLASAGEPFPATRLCIALVCLVVALALLLRRGWARGLGMLVALLLVGFHLWTAPLGEGVAANLVLFGSLAALLLLLLPATGDVRRGLASDKLPAPALARVLGVLAGLALAGAAAGLWLGATPGDATEPDASVGSSPLAERVRWSSFGRGMERALEEDKPLLVSFVANWCGYCRKMDRTTWKDPEVVRRTGEIVAVRVDAEEGRRRDGFSGRELAQRYGVEGYPTLIVMDPEGREIARTGGYQEPGQLTAWLDGSLARRRRAGGEATLPAAIP